MHRSEGALTNAREAGSESEGSTRCRNFLATISCFLVLILNDGFLILRNNCSLATQRDI